MKRKERHQLKADELVTTVSRVVNFLKRRARELMMLGAAVVVIVFILIIANFIKAQNIKKESRLIYNIFEMRSELDEHPEKVAELEKMAGRKRFSRLPYLLLATYWVEKGNFDKAEESLGKLKKGEKDILHYQAQDLIAQIQIMKGNYDRAIEIYREIEKEKPKVYALDQVLFHHAGAHEKKGEKDEALALYKKIQEEYPQTSFSYDAAQKIRELEEKR